MKGWTQQWARNYEKWQMVPRYLDKAESTSYHSSGFVKMTEMVTSWKGKAKTMRSLVQAFAALNC
jgi:hypothetical protein